MGFEKLQQVLAEILGVSPSSITPDKSFVRDFGADSLTLFQILMAVESEYGIAAEEEDIAGWSTVGQLWEYLHHPNGGKESGLA